MSPTDGNLMSETEGQRKRGGGRELGTGTWRKGADYRYHVLFCCFPVSRKVNSYILTLTQVKADTLLFLEH